MEDAGQADRTNRRKSQRHRCDDCGMAFSRKSALESHAASHMHSSKMDHSLGSFRTSHTNSERSNHCLESSIDIQGQIFNHWHESDAAAHTHSGNSECSEDTQIPPQKSSVRHARRFECRKCGERFAWKSACLEHTMTQCADEDDFNYQECGSKLNVKLALEDNWQECGEKHIQGSELDVKVEFEEDNWQECEESHVQGSELDVKVELEDNGLTSKIFEQSSEPKKKSDHKSDTEIETECPEETNKLLSDSELEGDGFRYPNKEMLACRECESRFEWKSTLLTHIFSHDISDDLQLEDFIKVVPKNEISASETTTYTGVKMYQCPECGKRIARKGDLERHILAHNAPKNFRCLKCDKSFSRKTHLDVHMAHHDAAKNFECQECGKHFVFKSRFDRHIRTHARTKDFKCEECGSHFQTNWGLTQHSHTHAVKSFVCQECGKQFAHNSSLHQHMHNHKDSKSFQCHECGKSFKLKRALKRHNLTHIDTKKFGCLECGKEFGQKCHLDRHFLIHLGTKDFECDICLENFRRKDILKKHMKTHSKLLS
ncbi:gastrula zinc finger protein XlCGF46.1-like isoform X2 [Eriocheir sinensis]|uniref:gastrula zinc finger protein XlCGF46.1-like isoform X2 n=1 Tax=Eriocheir sinensis TaxID=95602 RepID=UPI0021C7427A|nr:gastrula zinc finger protein XlCGF46.1-like isoform X2 [Eriocheir sinensis]